MSDWFSDIDQVELRLKVIKIMADNLLSARKMYKLIGISDVTFKRFMDGEDMHYISILKIKNYVEGKR